MSLPPAAGAGTAGTAAAVGAAAAVGVGVVSVVTGTSGLGVTDGFHRAAFAQGGDVVMWGILTRG